MKGFILTSVHEHSRQEQVASLLKELPGLKVLEAVYPKYEKVPFVGDIIQESKRRTGHALTMGELGCLLSHRKIWWEVVKNAKDDNDTFLVLESDSSLQDADFLKQNFDQVTSEFDLFFWGAWEGHMKLFRSTKRKMNNRFIGVPFIKAVYCTYAYSVNKTAAAFLLKKTGKVSYPVDQFKKFFKQFDIRLGGVQPEIISTLELPSYIKEKRSNRFLRKLFLMFLDIKNNMICFFK
ncbi:MAG: hypothetical protein JWN76_945 [Chitinophagaceae bacterium]|nr:hypothetical protein [Chitinophagaceae bacterium]